MTQVAQTLQTAFPRIEFDRTEERCGGQEFHRCPAATFCLLLGHQDEVRTLVAIKRLFLVAAEKRRAIGAVITDRALEVGRFKAEHGDGA